MIVKLMNGRDVNPGDVILCDRCRMPDFLAPFEMKIHVTPTGKRFYELNGKKYESLDLTCDYCGHVSDLLNNIYHVKFRKSLIDDGTLGSQIFFFLLLENKTCLTL